MGTFKALVLSVSSVHSGRILPDASGSRRLFYRSLRRRLDWDVRRRFSLLRLQRHSGQEFYPCGYSAVLGQRDSRLPHFFKIQQKKPIPGNYNYFSMLDVYRSAVFYIYLLSAGTSSIPSAYVTFAENRLEGTFWNYRLPAIYRANSYVLQASSRRNL